MRFLIPVLGCFLSFPLCAMEYPESRREATSDSFHEVVVDDPYRWLEDWSDQEVKAWSTAQAAMQSPGVSRKSPSAAPSTTFPPRGSVTKRGS
jgi:hypothetical protein